MTPHRPATVEHAAGSPPAARRRPAPRHATLPCPACTALTATTGGECGRCAEPLFTTACEPCGETLFVGHAYCITCGTRMPGIELPWAEGTPVPERSLASLAPTVPFWRLEPDEVDAHEEAPTQVRRPPPPRPPRRRIALRNSRGYCPRCRGPLVQQAVAAADLDECRRCGGIFLEATELTRLVFDPVSATAVARNLRGRPAPMPPNQLRGSCPICARALVARDLPRLGARAMVCGAHGAWFEHDELLNACAALGEGALDARSPLEQVVFADDLRNGRWEALLAHARALKGRDRDRIGPLDLLAAVLG